MKAISIKEPYATLIAIKKKTMETRSWKTNYRGEILIHASASRIPREWKNNSDLMGRVKSYPMGYGKILAKARLVDCVEMTEEFVEEIKKSNPDECACGFYSVGRYAWVLEDVQPICPVDAKGKLGIWEYKEGEKCIA